MRALVRGAGAIAVTLLIGACGDGTTTRREGREPAGELPAFDINAVPRDELRTGGTLRWPLPGFPVQWNLMRAGGAKEPAGDVLRGLLPYVMRCDEKAVPHPDPDYLTGVKVGRRSGRQVVTYTLNPRAMWSDGTPITYRDYAAQAGTLSGRDRRFQVASAAGYDHIEKVRRGANDHQVVVTFARPLADWPALFSPLYPAATSSDPETFNSGWLNRIGVTAGPFMVGTVDETAKTITVTRNARWWGRPAKLDRIVYRAMDAAAIPRAFAAGEVDVMDIGADSAAYRQAAGVRGAVVRRAGGPDWRELTLNAARPPLSDVRVRRALALGIDRAAITRSGFTGLPWPMRTLNNHFFMNTQEGYQDNSGELSVYDPAHAMRLLEEAGWRRQGAYRVKDGKTLTLRLAVPVGAPRGRQEAELVQGMLGRIGLRLDLQMVRDDRFEGGVTPGEFDIVAFSRAGAPFPVSMLRPVFAEPRGGRGERNHSRIGSARIDLAMDRALQELDPAKARGLTNDADRLIWQEMSVLPLYQRPQLVATRAALANLGARGFYDLAYEDIGFTSH